MWLISWKHLHHKPTLFDVAYGVFSILLGCAIAFCFLRMIIVDNLGVLSIILVVLCALYMGGLFVAVGCSCISDYLSYKKKLQEEKYEKDREENLHKLCAAIVEENERQKEELQKQIEKASQDKEAAHEETYYVPIDQMFLIPLDEVDVCNECGWYDEEMRICLMGCVTVTGCTFFECKYDEDEE